MITNEEDTRTSSRSTSPHRVTRLFGTRASGAEARPPQLARRRLRASRRDDDRRRRLQLPHPLHPPHTGSSARSGRPASACTTRRGRSARSTATRRCPAAAARLGDQRLLDRRLHEDGEAPLGLPGAGVVPVRPAAALGRADPPGRLLAARRRAHRQPARARALALRAAVGGESSNHPSLAIMLPNGNIAINDDYNHRVVIVDPKKRIVWQYGHLDRPGRFPTT